MHISDECFDEWVREYTRLLFGIAFWWTSSRVDAEEIVQEAFFQAYKSRSTLRDKKVAKAWLIGIMRHCYAQSRNKEITRAETPITDLPVEPTDKERVSLEVLSLQQALSRLDDKHRMPLILFYFEELSYQEIADSLDLPIGTVMSRLSRAKQVLHREMSSRQKLNVIFKEGER